MRLGIAGYMGAGKSLAVTFLSERYGWAVIDADKVARTLMVENHSLVETVVREFGTEHSHGGIDFRRLGALVFSDSQALLRLNALVHPLLIEQIRSLQETSSKTTLLDAALLPLWKESQLCDAALWIDAPEKSRLQRLLQRTPTLDEVALFQRMEGQEMILKRPAKSALWSTIENGGKIGHFYTLLEEWGSRYHDL